MLLSPQGSRERPRWLSPFRPDQAAISRARLEGAFAKIERGDHAGADQVDERSMIHIDTEHPGKALLGNDEIRDSYPDI